METKVLQSLVYEYSRYLQDEKGLADTTCSGYLKQAEDCLSFLTIHADQVFLPKNWNWGDLDRRAVEMYMGQLRPNMKPSTLHRIAGSLRSFFKFLETRGHIRKNILLGFSPGAPALDAPLPEDDTEAVQAMLEGGRDTLESGRTLAVGELIYGAGLKPSTVYLLKSMKLETQGVQVMTDQEEVLSKTLSASGVARLKAYLTHRNRVVSTSSGPLWVGRKGQAVSAGRLGSDLRKTMERNNLNGGARMLRTLSAVHFKQAGGDVRSLKTFLGVKRIGRLDRFAPPDFKAVLEGFRKAHPREEVP